MFGETVLEPYARNMFGELPLGILVLEDDLSVRELLADVLPDKLTCEIFLASTGQEALQIASREHLDLLLLDYHIRGTMTGLEVYDQLCRSQETPAIMISADPPDIGSRSLNLLKKPFDLEDLFARIEKCLRGDEIPSG